MNKKQKGTRKENDVKKQLEDEGYTVVFKSYTIKLGVSGFFRAIDFAGLFDLIAIKDKQWRLISVKSYKMTDKHTHWQNIVDWAKKHACEGMIVELWSYYPARVETEWTKGFNTKGKLINIRKKVRKRPGWIKFEYEVK